MNYFEKLKAVQQMLMFPCYSNETIDLALEWCQKGHLNIEILKTKYAIWVK